MQFEQENEQLFSEMNSMVDEVRQIEGKVLEISRLQEIFTEKVLIQVKYDVDCLLQCVCACKVDCHCYRLKNWTLFMDKQWKRLKMSKKEMRK